LLTLERLLPYLANDEQRLARLQRFLEGIDSHESMKLALIGDRIIGLTTFDNPATTGATRVPSGLYSAYVGDNKHKLLETIKELEECVAGPWPQPLLKARQYELPADGEMEVVSPWGGEPWLAPSGFAK